MSLLRKRSGMIKTWRSIGKGSALGCAIISAIFAIVPEETFNCVKICEDWSDANSILINRLILCAIVFCVSNLIYWCYKKLRKKVKVKIGNYVIQIEYADLMDIPEGKVVISFDECFTTNVGDAPGDVRASSICGQYLEKHKNENNGQKLDVQRVISDAEIKPEKGKSKYRAKIKYKPGTIVPNGNELLMAFAKLDENGRGNLTYTEYLDCLNKLWEQIDIYHGTDDVYIPILGSRIIYFDREFTQQELLDIMINSYCLSAKKLKEPNKLHIVCRKRAGFTLNDVFGIE